LTEELACRGDRSSGIGIKRVLLSSIHGRRYRLQLLCYENHIEQRRTDNLLAAEAPGAPRRRMTTP
jgi:hypothetical protein